MHAILADIDVLKELFDEMDPTAVTAARASVCAKRRGRRIARGALAVPPAPSNRLRDPLGDENWDSDDVDPYRVFLRLLSTSNRLVTTINRGQDYTQSALNGRLRAAPNSHTLECLLHDTVRIMRPLAPPSRRIVVHPMVISPQCPLVPWAIFDGPWIMDSLLCLLDNAFCYGTEVRGG